MGTSRPLITTGLQRGTILWRDWLWRAHRLGQFRRVLTPLRDRLYVLACTQRHPDGYGFIQEADVRFAYGGAWYVGNGPVPAGKNDLRSVAAHEEGHRLGLSHQNSSLYLTMSDLWGPGTLDPRTLGWGDYTGMQVLYP